MNVVDLFAGPGGWDLGAKRLGLDPLGIEWDEAACATRKAAGLRTVQADVSALDPRDFAPCDLLIASPPCQAWSAAGKREGRLDQDLCFEAARDLLEGRDTRAELRARCKDPRSILVVEPLRWALALKPRFVALEQVPPVLGYWRALADAFRALGYAGVWTGVLEAERYGVPQTRERAILLASRDGEAFPPGPTHQRYVPGEPATPSDDLFGGGLKPWVSMAEALGWNPADLVGFPRRDDRGGDGYRERDLRPASAPAFNLTEKARSWTRRVALRSDAQANATVRALVEPAPTIKAGHSNAERVWIDGEGVAVERVAVEEAAVLQTFPREYPWQGSTSRRFLQVGNAVPPLLAERVLGALVGGAS